MQQNIGDNKLKPGDACPDFALPATDGNTYGLESFSDIDILVVTFTCNHCPYAQAYEGRMKSIQKDYQDRGVQLVAICSNDERGYPEDSFNNMVLRAEQEDFNFPYLRDEDQSAARAFGAQCTPEFFVFDRDRKLVYHGRLDDNWQQPEKVTRQDLRDALEATLEGEAVEKAENPAIGCSIKWAM